MLIVTTRCNYRCKYCGMWKFRPAKDMSMEVLDKTIPKMKEFGIRFVGLTGGEPTLHPRLPDIIKKLKDNGFVVGVTTNGRAYDYNKLKDVDQIQISLDSARPEKMDEWRGAKGAWALAVDAVERSKVAGIKSILANVLITEENVGELDELFDFVSNKLGIKIGACDPNFGRNDSFAYDSTKELRPEFHVFWDRIIDSYDKYAFADPKDLFMEIKRFWKGEKRTFPCLGGFVTFNISVDGEFYPCFSRNDIVEKPTYGECTKCTVGCFLPPSMVYYQLRHSPLRGIRNVLWYGALWLGERLSV